MELNTAGPVKFITALLLPPKDKYLIFFFLELSLILWLIKRSGALELLTRRIYAISNRPGPLFCDNKFVSLLTNCLN